ncbi:Uncharacterised protein [Providencia rustigianii]|nr:Uncharacterised protein [Providencia rustigianii]
MKLIINSILVALVVKMLSITAIADVVELKNLLKDSLDNALKSKRLMPIIKQHKAM